MPVSGGLFTRIWKFVDQFASGDEIERQHLDVALDDVADGLNSILTDLDDLASAAVEEAVALEVGESITNAEAAATAAAASAVEAAVSAAAAAGYAAAMDALQINWRSAWEVDEEYGERDFVRATVAPYTGNTYYCKVPHTSVDFEDDLTAGKWELFIPAGAPGSGAGDMLYSENLSGLTDKPAARVALGLGLAAVQDFMPVQQGGGVSQGTNKVRIGWHTGGNGLRAQVDATPLGTLATIFAAGSLEATRFYVNGTGPLFACRAFGAFNSLGVISTSTGHVAAIAKVATGRYTVSLAANMVAAGSYVVVLGIGSLLSARVVNKTINSFQIEIFNSAGTLTDGTCNFAVFE